MTHPRRTLPRVRELKRSMPGEAGFRGGRTLPRVRELKLGIPPLNPASPGRTLPRVRELKRNIKPLQAQEIKSHPSQGA